jgi:hypothetical protein
MACLRVGSGARSGSASIQARAIEAIGVEPGSAVHEGAALLAHVALQVVDTTCADSRSS